MAIMTGTSRDLYKDFNGAVTVAGRSPQDYRDNFHFKTLHFLLTDALATLRAAQKEQQCHLVFRAMVYIRHKAKPGDIVQFGHFVSLLFLKIVPKTSGNTTVFQVKTCHGVDINAFARLSIHDHVLIPPSEKFKVTKVIEKGKAVEIHLVSIGTYSKYNCEWLRGGSIPRAPCHLGGPPGHQSPGTGNQHPLSHEVTKVTKVTKVIAATTNTKTTRTVRCPHWSLWPLPSMALLALTLALLAMTVATRTIEEKPLDMAPDSFDDQYQGCGPAMKAELPALNRSDLQKNCLLAKVWSWAVGYWQYLGSPASPLLTPDQVITFLSYTMIYLHYDFNDQVRVGGRSPQEYRDNFHYKMLHFLMTDALATHRAAQGQKCHCVLLQPDRYKWKASVGDTVRFGQFMGSQHCENDTYRSRITMGLKVQTCHGADINEFWAKTNKSFVLIPPFEKFKVTKVIKDGENVEIHLNSIGTYSKYNCEWLKAPEKKIGALLMTGMVPAFVWDFMLKLSLDFNVYDCAFGE
ncbi:hypothetical protein TURU_101827 [Turdus rufiventris]|nr:hypothetical protein TURU_101827 [Turdus rufiventris]